MAELVWSLNGKYFKDFGVGISSSDGILGELKPKKQDTKDWSEYNGVALDLTKKTKYEAREFTLSGWIVGADWLTMVNNFNALFGEFRNAGKQRLLLDVFGQKTYVFDVRCDDEIELKKTFKQGKMVGMFSLKLIEHNPIKKILYTANSNLQLTFNTPKWVEVNIDGKIDTYKGSVNINKALTGRVLTGYNTGGRNLLVGRDYLSSLNIPSKNYSTSFDGVAKWFTIAGDVVNGSEIVQDKWFTPKEVGNYTFSMFIICDKIPTSVKVSFLTQQAGHNEITAKIDFVSENKYKITASVNLTNLNAVRIVNLRNIQLNGNPQIIGFQYPKLEKGNKATDWTPAPEDQHFISIAGNIDEITGLTTNADVLWERL